MSTVAADPSDRRAEGVVVDAAVRGTLTIDPRVVERVAGHALTGVKDVTAAPRRVLGVNLGQARAQDQPQVTAQVNGQIATVEATIAVRWPASIRSVTAQARQHIRDDVARITDVQVDHVDIDVASMDMPTATTRRVR